jgi:hypothetical protein
VEIIFGLLLSRFKKKTGETKGNAENSTGNPTNPFKYFIEPYKF